MSEVTPTGPLRMRLNAYRTDALKILQAEIPYFQVDKDQDYHHNKDAAEAATTQQQMLLTKIRDKTTLLQTATDKYEEAVAEILKAANGPNATPEMISAANKENEKLNDKLYRDNGIMAILAKMQELQSQLDALKDSTERQIKDLKEGITGGLEKKLQHLDSSSDDEELMRLPKINVPKFSGDPLEWTRWWNIFKTQIHQRKKMNVTLKFSYLNDSLKGKAKKLLGGLNMDGADYMTAIKLLKSNFGNTTYVTNTLWEKLYNLQSPTMRGDSLMAFRREVGTTLTQLAERGENTESGAVLRELRKYLSPELRLAVTEDFRRENPRDDEDDDEDGPAMTVKTFVKALGNVAQARLECQTTAEASKQNDNTTKQQNNKIKSKGVHNTVAYSSSEKRAEEEDEDNTTCAAATTQRPAPRTYEKRQQQKQTKPPANYKCLFCSGNEHWTTDCDQYPTIEDCKLALKAMLNRCPRCTKLGHDKANCQSELSCYYCRSRDKHHSTMCPDQFDRSSNNKTTSSSSSNTREQKTTANAATNYYEELTPEPDSKPHRRTETAAATTKAAHQDDSESLSFKVVRLQMAQSPILNKETGIMSEHVNIFFDTGCEYSYIRQDLAHEIELDNKGDLMLSMNVFATPHPLKVKAKLVEITIPQQHLGHEDLSMLVRAVPELATYCQPPPLSINDKNMIYNTWGINADELFAEKFETATQLTGTKLRQPAVVIGQDNFWKFDIKQTGLQLPSGLLVVSSTLGFMLAGASEQQIDDNHMDFAMSATCGSTAVAIGKETLRQFHSLEAVGITDDPYAIDDGIAEHMQFQGFVVVKHVYTHSLIGAWKLHSVDFF